MWEQFRGLALPLLGQHFPPELIKDNGDSIVFTSRRDDAPPDWLDAGQILGVVATPFTMLTTHQNAPEAYPSLTSYAADH